MQNLDLTDLSIKKTPMQLRPHKILLCGATTFITTILLFWCFRQIDVATIWRNLYQVSIIPMLAAMLVLLAILWLKSIQWQLFLPSNAFISFQSVFRVIAIMVMMANVLPWGQTFAIYHLGKIHKIGKTVALSVITLDQIATGFSKLTLFLLAALATPLPAWMKRGIVIALCLVVGIYLFLLYFSHRHRHFKDAHHLIHNRWQDKLLHSVAKWAHHLQALRNWKKMCCVIALGLLVKLCEVGAIFLVQKGFGLMLPWWSAIFVLAGLNLATIVPITPGNIGIFEATIFFVYQFLGLEASQAMSLALFQHFIYLISMVLPGYLISIKSGFKFSQMSKNEQF